MKKYCIKYEIWLNDGSKILDKEINIDNCESSLHAQTRLDTYLKKNYDNFKQLIVISCKEDELSAFSKMFNMNNKNGKGYSSNFMDDILKNNPFSTGNFKK